MQKRAAESGTCMKACRFGRFFWRLPLFLYLPRPDWRYGRDGRHERKWKRRSNYEMPFDIAQGRRETHEKRKNI